MQKATTQGSVEIVMIPVVWSLSREHATIAEQTGALDKIRENRADENEQARRELASYLDQGYSVIGQELIETSGRTLLTFTLYRPAPRDPILSDGGPGLLR